MPECSECRFYEQIDSVQGSCRRYAPRVQFERHHNIRKRIWLREAYAIWPTVSSDEWCGEYVAREA